MCAIWHCIHILTVAILATAARVLAVFFPKLRTRHHILRLQTSSLQQQSGDRLTFWFHAASAGELEQIKPLIRLVRSRYPEASITVSVFSPSAYREHPDVPYNKLFLLPYDTPWNARRFIEGIHPRVVIVSRYDLWWNIVHQLSKRKIPIILVNATFPSSGLSNLLRSYYRCLYNQLSMVIARSPTHAERFRHLQVATPLLTLPDTRIDQLAAIASKVSPIHPPFLDTRRFRLILGSTWHTDERLWAKAWNMLDQHIRQQLQLIIVPHEPTPRTCKRLLRLFNESVLSSEAVDSNTQAPVVVVNQIGILSSLYRYASAAYVGGGFGAGVHSLIEPAMAGIPVSCGPRIRRSDDAYDLLHHESLRIINSSHHAIAWVQELLDNDSLQLRARRYAHTLAEVVGVSEKVMGWIEQLVKEHESIEP
ncbi:MAG: hypothetical protein N2663_06565 [Chlorobi bacterium]|nr:hypothetical protein [Chlorobiota bacterium]